MLTTAVVLCCRRRLTPCFKVRVEVKHRGNVSLPLTLRAHVLNQQDKDDISRWMPAQGRDDESDREDKASTEPDSACLLAGLS